MKIFYLFNDGNSSKSSKFIWPSKSSLSLAPPKSLMGLTWNRLALLNCVLEGGFLTPLDGELDPSSSNGLVLGPPWGCLLTTPRPGVEPDLNPLVPTAFSGTDVVVEEPSDRFWRFFGAGGMGGGNGLPIVLI